MKSHPVPKVGDLIGVGAKGSKSVDLYCRVESIDSDGMRFEVINGRWEGGITPTGSVWVKRYPDNTREGCEILFSSPLPKSVRGDYNAAIYYMDDHLSRNSVARWAQSAWLSVSAPSSFIGRARFALKAGTRAGMRAWRGQRPDLFDDDDDVAF